MCLEWQFTNLPLQSRYGPRFNQPPSSSVNQVFRQEIQNKRAALEQATTSDRSILDRYKKKKDEIGFFSGGPAALESWLRKAVADKNVDSNNMPLVDLLTLELPEKRVDEKQAQVQVLKAQVSDLKKLEKERQAIWQELREKVQNDDISHLLLLNRRSSHPPSSAMFKEEIEKFNPLRDRIKDNLDIQEKLLVDFAAKFSSLKNSRSVKQAQERLNNAREKSESLKRRATDVISEYKDLEIWLE